MTAPNPNSFNKFFPSKSRFPNLGFTQLVWTWTRPGSKQRLTWGSKRTWNCSSKISSLLSKNIRCKHLCSVWNLFTEQGEDNSDRYVQIMYRRWCIWFRLQRQIMKIGKEKDQGVFITYQNLFPVEYYNAFSIKILNLPKFAQCCPLPRLAQAFVSYPNCLFFFHKCPLFIQFTLILTKIALALWSDQKTNGQILL